MGRQIDITGFVQTKGRLTAIRYSHTRQTDQRAIWDCDCACGGEVQIDSYSFRSEAIKSCGCLNRLRLEAKKYLAFQEEKTIAQWLKDPRCAVEETVLRSRLRLGKEFQWALTTPPRWTSKDAPVFAPKGKGIPLKELLKRGIGVKIK